jgi:hypothetical protein
MQNRNNRRPNGPTDREIQQARALLASRICDYNQANLFLASVIRKTVSKEQALFPLLHQYITNNTHQIENDAHTLLYAVKREMSHTQKTLSSRVNNEMQQLQITVDGTLPLIRPYISKLHASSIMYCRLGVISPAHSYLLSSKRNYAFSFMRTLSIRITLDYATC